MNTRQTTTAKPRACLALCLLLTGITSVAPLHASIRGVAGYFTPSDSFQHAIVGDSDGQIHEVFFNPAKGVFQDVLGCFRQTKAVTGFYTADDQLEHVIVATADGTVSEIYFSSGQSAAEATIGQFSGLLDIAGFYTPDDGYRHIIVGTTDGNVTEIFYKPSTGIFKTVIAHYNSSLIALDGFYTPDDNYRHVIVATADGSVHELFYNPQTGSGDAILATYSGIIDVAGFYTADDNYRHAIVATIDGDIHEIFYHPSSGSGQAVLSSYSGVVGIAGYFTPTDNYRHIIVGTEGGNVDELFYSPLTGQGSDVLATFQPLVPGATGFSPAATNSPAGGSLSSAGLTIALAGDASATYAVSLNAGVWKSTQGGPWVQLPNSPRYGRCIAVDPNNAAHLAVGERDGDAIKREWNNAGVWESSDAGNTWVYTLDPLSRSGCNSQAISAIALSRASTLFLATPCGLCRKPAGATTFDFTRTPAGVSWVTAVTVSESNIWARTPGMLLVSSDDGVSWTTIAIPSVVDGYQVTFNPRGDVFSLGAFDAYAYLVFQPNPDTVQNHNTLLIYNVANGNWKAQVQSTGNGSGLGGQRFIKSFVLNNMPHVIGEGLQLVFGEGQDVERAISQNQDGTLQWRLFAATQGSGSPNRDPVHSDVWDFVWDPGGYQSWLCGDGGVWSIAPFAEFPAWYPHNENLMTHHIHSVTVTQQDHVHEARVAYSTSDNDAWLYDEISGWRPANCCGDANWTDGDMANSRLVITARDQMYIPPNCPSWQIGSTLKSLGGPAPTGALVDQDLCLVNVEPPSWLFMRLIQTLKQETAPPNLDAVMVVKLPLMYRDANCNLVPVPGTLGQPNPGGNPVLIRNTDFALSPDANLSKFQTWQIEANNLPSGTAGIWASGGHANPVYYVYTVSGSTGALYRRNAPGGDWERLNVEGLLVGGANGPAFVNPYDPNRIYALTSCGVMVSTDGGVSFRGDAILTALLTASGKYPLTADFSGGTDPYGYEPIASRANRMATLSCIAFSRENPLAAVAASPFTGVFYDAGDGMWRDLTRYLPTPFTPVSAVSIDCEAIYVATEGRGLIRLTGYDNAPAAATPPGAVLKILSISAGPPVTITWQSSPGFNYRVQYKDNLADASWTDLSGDILAVCLIASKSDPGGTQHRFYRVIQLP